MLALYKQRNDDIQWNRFSFLQACEGMIALLQWNRLSFLQTCEGMIALYKQRKDNIQGLLYSIYYEQIELQAKLLNYFLGSNKSNINQSKPEVKLS